VEEGCGGGGGDERRVASGEGVSEISADLGDVAGVEEMRRRSKEGIEYIGNEGGGPTKTLPDHHTVSEQNIMAVIPNDQKAWPGITIITFVPMLMVL